MGIFLYAKKGIYGDSFNVLQVVEMSLLVRKDMQLSTDPFAAHHLVVKRPSSHGDTDGVAAKKSKPDDEGVFPDVTLTSEQPEKELNTEKLSSIHVECQPEVCICSQSL